MLFPKMLGLFFAAGGTLFGVSGCSYFDAHDSPAAPSHLPGRLVETTYSDADLEAQNLKVLYRFRSVPNLVMVKSQGFQSSLSQPSGAMISIADSSVFQNLMAQHGGDDIRRTVPDHRLNLISALASRGAARTEAGFSTVYSDIAARGIVINSVQVAVVDSGVIPVSYPMKMGLTSSTNLTLDTDECRWSEHGTAIASVFFGVFSGGNSPCSTSSYAATEQLMEPGLSPFVRLHSIKISFGKEGQTYLRPNLESLQLAAALDEAVASGSQIVNLSIAYDDKSPPYEASLAEQYVMAKAAERGVVFVAAAGNAGRHLKGVDLFPATYKLDNIVVVGSHTTEMRHALNSNYGVEVDVTAQGDQVLTLGILGNEERFSGTSFAVPIVVSALSLYRALNPNGDYRAMLRDLYSSSNPNYAWDQSPSDGPISRYGRLDVVQLLKNQYR